MKNYDILRRSLTRREFLQVSAYSAALAGLGLTSSCQTRPPKKRTRPQAVVLSKPTTESLKQIKDAGFDGIESGMVTVSEAEQICKTADALDLRVHSVMRGWAKFNSDDKAEAKKSFEVTIDSLKLAKVYGADVILLVPGRIGNVPMPEPWEFRIKFNEDGHLANVAENDNGRYSDYITAHNQAYDTFSDAINRLIPEAEKAGVVIAVENVWSNLFVEPVHFAHFIDSFESPWVRAYFDIGNHVKYSSPQEWISVLGKRIVKCHVKDFKLNADGRGGKFADIRDGSVDWPVVMKALDDSGYSGWMTIEGSDKLSLSERNKRLDVILAGL